jgi:hypothetical protein
MRELLEAGHEAAERGDVLQCCGAHVRLEMGVGEVVVVEEEEEEEEEVRWWWSMHGIMRGWDDDVYL